MPLNQHSKIMAMITAILLNAAPPAMAQDERSATLLIANSTDATLSIEVARGDEVVVLTLRPLTERSVTVPAGFVQLIANAAQSSPPRIFETGFAISTGRSYSINLVPQDFGASFMADRPSADAANQGSGLTVNTARLAMDGAEACRQASPDTSQLWYINTPGGTSYYSLSGDYLCADSGDGLFVLMGGLAEGAELVHFGCRNTFETCDRNPPRDARLGARLAPVSGRERFEFIWTVGGRMDTLSESSY